MKTLEKVRNRIKRYLKGRKKPVIRIPGRDPWRGQKLVQVPVPSEFKKIVGILIFGLFLTACAGSGAEVLPETGGTDAGVISTEDITLQALDAAINQLSQSTGVSAEQIQVLTSERVEWPDACLGLASQDEACAQVVTPGFRIVLQAGDQTYEFHTDESGTHIRQRQ